MIDSYSLQCSSTKFYDESMAISSFVYCFSSVFCDKTTLLRVVGWNPNFVAKIIIRSNVVVLFISCHHHLIYPLRSEFLNEK